MSPNNKPRDPLNDEPTDAEYEGFTDAPYSDEELFDDYELDDDYEFEDEEPF